MAEELANHKKQKDILIPNQERLDFLLKQFKKGGKEKIHVLADFDRTLTQCFVNGERITSLISILRKENILNEAYTKRTEELFNIYHPIETDSQLPLEEKKKKMAEWWELHNQELLKHGLNKKHLDIVAASPKVILRSGAAEFFKLLNENQIPVVIMSSSGVGDYVISKVLKREKIDYPNIQIISNSMSFDEQGNLISFNKPYIHVLNKDETMVKDFPLIFDKIKERENVILLGDNIEDIGMIEGFAYDNLIKIVFLNENVDENLPVFKKNFDLIILNDGDMDFINQILKEII